MQVLLPLRTSILLEFPKGENNTYKSDRNERCLTSYGISIGCTPPCGCSFLELGPPDGNIFSKKDDDFVFTSNYEPNQKLLKHLFEAYLVNSAFFYRQTNDCIGPVNGAIFEEKALKSVVNLEANQY